MSHKNVDWKTRNMKKWPWALTSVVEGYVFGPVCVFVQKVEDRLLGNLDTHTGLVSINFWIQVQEVFGRTLY